jgi:uncharacterized protein YecE (DUF72 family)
MPEIRIGCSGFNYQHWKGRFYPEDLVQKNWFLYYCRVFNTVELNVTFYRLPGPETFEKWYRETPADFAFSLKGSRFITHIKRILEPEKPLDLFFSGALLLQDKLRAVLWQFPPSFEKDAERLRNFLDLLANYPVRNALEFRHHSWITEDVFDLCREHDAGLCMADWPEYLDELPVVSDFVYIRRHGAGGSYDTCYSKASLERDATRIRGYRKDGKDVFVYFNNDAYGYAPENARVLLELL